MKPTPTKTSPPVFLLWCILSGYASFVTSYVFNQAKLAIIPICFAKFTAVKKDIGHMKESFVFLADGFEDIEALTVIDLLRRAGMPVKTVSIARRFR